MQLQKLTNKNQSLLAVMVLMQILWLIGIGVTGASTDRQKLLGLGIYSLVCGIIVLIPYRITPHSADLYLRRIFGNHKKLLSVILVTVFAVGVIYAFVQRIWPWDEEFSFLAARMIAENGLHTFFDNYSQILWVHNHPPLIILLNGFALRLFGSNIIFIRILSLIFLVGTVLLTYLIALHTSDTQTALLAAIMLPTFPLVYRLGTAGLLDIQVTFFFTLAVFLLFLLLRKPGYTLAIALSLVISAGLLTKYTMFFILPVIGAAYLIDWRNWKPVPYLALVGMIVGIIFISWLSFGQKIGLSVPGFSILQHLQKNVSRNVTQDNQEAILPPPGKVENISVGWYLTTKEGIVELTNNLGTKLVSAIGPYNVPLIVLGLIFVFRRRLKTDKYLIIWVATVFLLLVLTLPDHRYFMPIFPALAIMMAIWLKSHPDAIHRAVLLSVLYLGAALYLFADWFRAAQLFQK